MANDTYLKVNQKKKIYKINSATLFQLKSLYFCHITLITQLNASQNALNVSQEVCLRWLIHLVRLTVFTLVRQSNYQMTTKNTDLLNSKHKTCL